MNRDKPFLEGSKRTFEALAELHDALEPSGGVVVLGGPRGVGKSILLGELRRALSARGRLVLLGRADQAATHPFAALREPAAQALAFLESRGVAEEFLDTHARALAVLLPGLQAAPSVRARDKTGFLEALRSFFIALGRHGPLTLLLADLHYADDDTREAVRYLAHHLFSPELPGGVVRAPAQDGERLSGVLMVGTRTDDDDGAALAHMLLAARGSRRLEVGGLSRAQLLDYLATHPLLDKLLTASRGRYEDVDELLESLPRDTDALLHQRIQILEPTARRALHALAVIGRPTPPDLLAAMAQAPAAEVAQALGQLVESRLLVRRLHNGELLFTFAHPHHGEVLRETLTPEARAALHHAIAVRLEERGGDLAESLLAFHYLRGQEPQRAVPWVLQACEKLLLTFAYGTLIALVERTLPVANGDERFALLGHLVEAYRLRGDFRAALAHAEPMRALASPRQLPTVLRRLGELYSARGDHRTALELLEQAVALLDRDGVGTDEAEVLPERALVAAAMAESAFTKNALDEARLRAEAALAAAPHAPLAFRIRCRNTLGKVAFARDNLDEAEAVFLENVRLAESHGLEHEAILARVNTGLTRHRRGHHEEARDMLERAVAAARAAGDLHSEANALLNLAAIESRHGELGRALERYTAAWARFARLGDRNAVRRVTWNLANLTCALGDYEAARAWLEESRVLAEHDDNDRGRAFILLTEGDLAYNQGQPGAALTSYETARDIFLRIGETSRVVELTTKAAWAAVLLGDVAHAELRVSELFDSAPGTLQHARRAAVQGALLIVGGQGDAPTRGLSLLSTAVDELERLRTHDEAWRSLAFLAQRYDARGDERSAAAARARARAIVERAAARLPEDLRARMLADPLRAELSSPSERSQSHRPENSAAPRTPQGAAPASQPRPLEGPPLGERPLVLSTRKAEWDARYPELVGHASSLLRVLDRLDRVVRTRNTVVLIRGESGTGKELVAAAVHRLGERAQGPFVRVNCAALVETLLMSELFGHEKGSFTGALARKIGRFELARGGTIFLDEIGDISPKTQVSLLRVLQERQFERVGGTQTIHTDAAVICATHRDLEAMVREGTFREDLYYRLRGVVVEVPPLRERIEDIPLLVERFLHKTREEAGRAPGALSSDAAQVLMRHRWPGNIRELQNVIRSVALFCEGDVISAHHLAEFPELFAHMRRSEPTAAAATPPSSAVASSPATSPSLVERNSRAGPSGPFDAHPSGESPTPVPHEDGRSSPTPLARDVLGRVAAAADEGLALGDLKRRLEFEAIANAMRQTGGNITRAAALLRMKRPRLSQIVNGNPELKAIKDASRDADSDD